MICFYSSLLVLGLIFLVCMQSSYAIIWQNLVIASIDKIHLFDLFDL